MTKLTPRDYQQEIIKSVFESYDRGIARQLIVAATGMGKSFVAITIIKALQEQNKRVLILVDQEDLVWQWREGVRKVDDSLHIGIEKAEHKANKKSNVIIASVQTLGRKGNKRIKKFDPDYFDVIVCDEADKSIAESWFRVLNYFGFGNKNFSDGNLLVGMTATPYRSDGQSLGILYDDIVSNYDIRYGISQGWLTDIQVYNVSTNTDISKVKSYKDDFNQKELAEAIDNDERNEEIVKAYKEVCDGEQTIVYCGSVEHAYRLEAIFKTVGYRAKVIEANTDKDDRKQWLEDFRNGKINVLLNYFTLVVGIDFPELSTIIFARPFKSKRPFVQALGRVLRPSQSAYVDNMFDAETRRQAIANSDKPFAKVIDLHDTTGNHNVAHIPSLFGLNNELKTNEPKQFFKEVVEPLEQIQREKQIDISQIKDLDDVDVLVKNKKFDIQSLKLKPEVDQFTDRSWVEVGDDSYEIMYSDNNKALIIDKDDSKDELIGKQEWNLLEYDTKKEGVTKKLQTFNSLSGAFKIADEYADSQGWNSQFLEKQAWMNEGVSEGQLNMLNKLYKYKNGYAEFRMLNDRYEDTKVRKVLWKKTGEILSKGTASKLIDKKFNKR